MAAWYSSERATRPKAMNPERGGGEVFGLMVEDATGVIPPAEE